MRIKEIRVARKTYLFVAIIFFTCLHSYNFVHGYRLTADDVLYHSLYMNEDIDLWSAVADAAVLQGRISHFFWLPVQVMAQHLSDDFEFRIIFVLLFFLSFILIGFYVSELLCVNKYFSIFFF